MNPLIIRFLSAVALLSYALNSSATVVLENYKNTNEVTIKIVNEIRINRRYDASD